MERSVVAFLAATNVHECTAGGELFHGDFSIWMMIVLYVILENKTSNRNDSLSTGPEMASSPGKNNDFWRYRAKKALFAVMKKSQAIASRGIKETEARKKVHKRD